MAAKINLYYSIIYHDQYETIILKEFKTHIEAKKFLYTARNLKGELLKNHPGYSIGITTWQNDKQIIYMELPK